MLFRNFLNYILLLLIDFCSAEYFVNTVDKDLLDSPKYIQEENILSKLDFSDYEKSQNVLPPFRTRMSSLHLYDLDYGLRYCQIPKNMSSMMIILLCDLLLLTNRKFRGVRDDSLSSRCYLRPQQVLFKRLFMSNQAAWKPREKPQFKTWDLFAGWKHREKRGNSFVIVRDPVERFVSAYGHLCRFDKLCGEAGSSVHSMAPAIYRFFQDDWPIEGVAAGDQKHITFHFAPQNWFCHVGDLKAKKNAKLLRYSQNQDDNIAMVDHIFAEVGVGEKMRSKILSRMRTQRTRHSADRTQKQEWLDEIYRNQTTLEWIVKVYYWDFVLLGFDFPEIKDQNGIPESKEENEPSEVGNDSNDLQNVPDYHSPSFSDSNNSIGNSSSNNWGYSIYSSSTEYSTESSNSSTDRYGTVKNSGNMSEDTDGRNFTGLRISNRKTTEDTSGSSEDNKYSSKDGFSYQNEYRNSTGLLNGRILVRFKVVGE